jgi:hypothetical protein
MIACSTALRNLGAIRRWAMTVHVFEPHDTLLRLLPGPAQCFLKVLRMLGEQRLVDVILRFGVANFDHCHGAFAHDSARAIVS